MHFHIYLIMTVVAFIIPIGLGSSLSKKEHLKIAYIAGAVIYFFITLSLVGLKSSAFPFFIFMYIGLFTFPLSLGQRIRQASKKTKRYLHRNDEQHGE